MGRIMRSYFVSRILILKSNKTRDYSAWRTHGAPACCLPWQRECGSAQCEVFLPKDPCLPCILHRKFREVAWTSGKKRKQTGELKLILAVLLTGSGITLLACGSLGYEVLSQLVVEFWSFV